MRRCCGRSSAAASPSGDGSVSGRVPGTHGEAHALSRHSHPPARTHGHGRHRYYASKWMRYGGSCHQRLSSDAVSVVTKERIRYDALMVMGDAVHQDQGADGVRGRHVGGPALTDVAVLRELGARLARERLGRNQTQAALAEEAGVSRATVQRLEAGHSTQLTNLVRVLRALDLPGLHEIVPEPVVRPLAELQRLERGRRLRRRASSPRRRGGQRPGGDDGPWTWEPGT